MEIYIATDKEIEKAFSLRKEVFVVEQKVSEEIEIDDEDKIATHIIAEHEGFVVGTARIIFEEDSAHVGRLAVKKSYRGKGLGSAICAFIFEYCKAKGCKKLWLNSQVQAMSFYKKQGYKTINDVFWEAGIEHIQMQKMILSK